MAWNGGITYARIQQRSNNNFKLGSLERDLCVIDAGHGLLPYEIVFFDNPEKIECSGCFSSNLFLTKNASGDHRITTAKMRRPHMLSKTLTAYLGFKILSFLLLLKRPISGYHTTGLV